MKLPISHRHAGRMLHLLILASALLVSSPPGLAATRRENRIPVIDVTDLYHPYQDVGDNFDLITAYGLPEVDLKAVVFDCTGVFRAPRVDAPPPGLAADENGPREPGFIPVLQLNYIFNRLVPCGSGPFTPMKSYQDTMRDVPPFQQQGVDLLLAVLRTNHEPVHILSFGSARPIAVAFNRDPALFRKKVARIHLCAGATAPGFLEWNVALDRYAFVDLLRSQLPIALYPCAANNSRRSGADVFLPVFSYDSHNTYYSLPDLTFVHQMHPQLRRYLEFAFMRASRVDFLRAMDEDSVPPIDPKLFARQHSVWETAVWLCLTDRRLVLRSDGHYRIVAKTQVARTDRVLPNELHPCRIDVADDGSLTFRETKERSNFQIYFRGDPAENERALREALPALYLSLAPDR